MKDNIINIIKEEIDAFFKNIPYSLEEELILQNEILLGELLNPDNSLPYKEKLKGMWIYDDPNGVEFFVRVHWLPHHDFFEFKTGWFNEKGEATYEPSIPYGNKKVSSLDINSRSDTVAKIYRDEVLPFFEKQTLSNYLVIKPISLSRSKFAERLVKKFTPTNKFNIEYGLPLVITKK